MAATWFTDIKQAEPIEVFALVQRYNEDTDPTKVNLSVGGMFIFCVSLVSVTTTTRDSLDY